MHEKKNQELRLFLTAILLLLPVSGCASKISLSKNSGPIAHPTPSGKRSLLADATPQQPKKAEPSPPPPPPQNSGTPVEVTGHWKVGFLAGTKNLTSTVDLAQSGNSFKGEGVDDDSNLAFTVEKGTITGSQVEFFKVYKSGKGAPVDYSGTFQNVKDTSYSGPYLSGEYQVPFKGKTLSGQWEAEIVQESAPQPTPPADTEQPQQQAPSPPDHAPQLSGKWDIGFEYNFKIVHSAMYLEQDGGKVTGHGVDNSTKEKFVIAKGWYKFPKLTLIRKYVKKQGAASDREVTFKADVSWVSDKDYQGPYLHGKTQGGGDWEGQLQK
jgi:hypothetical protein